MSIGARRVAAQSWDSRSSAVGRSPACPPAHTPLPWPASFPTTLRACAARGPHTSGEDAAARPNEVAGGRVRAAVARAGHRSAHARATADPAVEGWPHHFAQRVARVAELRVQLLELRVLRQVQVLLSPYGRRGGPGLCGRCHGGPGGVWLYANGVFELEAVQNTHELGGPTRMITVMLAVQAMTCFQDPLTTSSEEAQ